MLMTRPQAAALRFVEEMPAPLRAKIVPLFSPLLEIVPSGGGPELGREDGAIFTSRNGVAHGPAGQGRMAYCIGQATTAAARDRGWDAQVMGKDADTLVQGVSRIAGDKRLVHFRGMHTRGGIAARLGSAGCAVREAVVYDQRLLTLSQEAREVLMGASLTIVPLFSPRTAMQFANQAPRPTCCHVIALSPAVADAAAPLAVDQVCDQPDAAAMYDAVAQAVASA